MMRLILRTTIEHLGKRGDVVKVKSGYGRNQLLPKGLAYGYSESNVTRVEKERKLLEIQNIQKQEEAAKLAQRMEAVSCTIVRKVGESETLYGAVTNGDIAEALLKEGFSIDKKKIDLEDPIKSLGIYTVPVRLHPGVTCDLKVWVVKE